MRAIATADLHININNRFEDTKAILRQICELAIKEKVQEVWVLGDVYDRKRPYSDERILFHKFVKFLTDLAIKVIIISGNHDTDQYKASALGEFGILDLPDVKLLPNPSVIDIGHSKVYLGHFLVDGAKLGSLNYSARDTMNVKEILKTPADLYLLGDVHKAQVLHTNPDILYVGSPERVSFGERGEVKGVTIVDVSPADIKPRYTFYPLKPRPMVQIDYNPSIASILMDTSKDVKDAIVKVKITCNKEEYKAINENKFREQLKDVYSVKFEYNILQEERKRKSTIGEGNTPLKAFEEYTKTVELDEQTIKLGKAIIGKA